MSPTRQLPYAILALTIALPAQRPDPVALPRLMQLGPMPEGGAVMILTKDGRLAKPHGQAEAPESVLLRIDRDTPMAGVTKLLETLRAKGTHRVQFAAELPNGDPGCFTLALPEGEATITTVALRLHRGRSGVPPTSVIPVLRRMNRCPLDEGFVVAIDTPDDLGFEAALRVLAAAQTAGV
ncbi:MAG: hypothetical protein KDC98_14090, partial [Planctomycetes bacterium]|nr:hypothetical protein [Planctomycetota bacterium]